MESTKKDVVFRRKMNDQEPTKAKHNMNTQSREADDQAMGEDPHNPWSSMLSLSLEAPHDARKSAGAVTKGTKGKSAASDSVPQIYAKRKVTPEKLTKWVVDTASAVVVKIPTIKTEETQMGSVGTTDKVTTLAGLPWSSKRVGNDTTLNFPGDFDEAHDDDDDTILAVEEDTQTGTTGDKILEALMHINEQSQTEEAGPGSTVHIRHPSLFSTSGSSRGVTLI